MNIDETTTKEILQDAPDLYRPSPFWEALAAVGVSQLRDGGFENFKRTVNMKYFNWNILGIVRHQLFPVFRYWLKNRDWSVFGATFPKSRDPAFKDIKSFNPVSAAIYRIYVAMSPGRIPWDFSASSTSLPLETRLPFSTRDDRHPRISAIPFTSFTGQAVPLPPMDGTGMWRNWGPDTGGLGMSFFERFPPQHIA
jgi:hypothetical protein